MGEKSQGVLEDGRKIDGALVRALIPEELKGIESLIAATGAPTATYAQAAQMFERLSLEPTFVEFLTLPMYEVLRVETAG